MEKTIYRTALFSGSDTLCEKLVVMASKSNGGDFIALSDLKTVADGNRLEYPSLFGANKVEIIGETLLHVDKKIGDEYKKVCSIEQVEIFELEEPVDDIPEGVFTATNGHGALAE